MLAGGAAIIWFNKDKKPLVTANAEHWASQKAKLAAAGAANGTDDEAPPSPGEGGADDEDTDA